MMGRSYVICSSFRKRIVRGVSILSCYGQLDVKNKEGKPAVYQWMQP